MSRHKNEDWNLPKDVTWGVAKLATLMDIRDELRTLTRILACPNFIGMPAVLRQVAENTKRPKRRRTKAKR